MTFLPFVFFTFLSSSVVGGEAGTDWKIAQYVGLTAEPAQAENMMAALDSAKKVAEEHEEVVRKAGRLTKFSRTNNLTEALAHNYMIKLSLEMAADQAVENRASSYPGFFRDICLSLSSQVSACTEPCEDLRYRTFTGCCNNLNNPEFGGETNGPPPPLDIIFYNDRKHQYSHEEVSDPGL